MFTPERTYSLLTLGALALAVLITVVALVHGIGELTLVW
jgi:hypothetical protein